MAARKSTWFAEGAEIERTCQACRDGVGFLLGRLGVAHPPSLPVGAHRVPQCPHHVREHLAAAEPRQRTFEMNEGLLDGPGPEAWFAQTSGVAVGPDEGRLGEPDRARSDALAGAARMVLAVRDEVQAAWADWTAAGVAMAGYNTEQSADDIDDLRRHLGADQIDLWGISYGSHLALSVLKRHGDRIRRVALASLEGQDQTVKRPAHIDAYLGRIDALLDAAPAVRAAVPDLPALMRRVHARLEAEPAAVTTMIGDAPVELALGGFGVQIMAGAMIANPGTIAMLPARRALGAPVELRRQVVGGPDHGAILPVAHPWRWRKRLRKEVMSGRVQVICIDQAPRAREFLSNELGQVTALPECSV